MPTRSIPSPVGNLSGNTQQEDQENCQGELLKKSAGEVPVDSPIDSKPLKEIKQMLESEKNSSNSTSVDTLHTLLFLLQMLEMVSEGKKGIVHLYII